MTWGRSNRPPRAEVLGVLCDLMLLLLAKITKAGIPESIPVPASVVLQLGVFVLVARIAVAGCGRRTRAWETRRAEACQSRIKRSDLERHLVAGRGDCDRSRLHHFGLVVPGVDLHATAQRQRRDLVQLIHIEGRPSAGKARQADHGAIFGKRGSKMRG